MAGSIPDHAYGVQLSSSGVGAPPDKNSARVSGFECEPPVTRGQSWDRPEVGTGVIVTEIGLTVCEKWLRKSEQGDKWNRCLIEGMIALSETGARDEQTTPP